MLEALTSSLVLGVSIGSIFLIAAIGLAVVYGAAGVINMAHGELIMLGAYTTYMMQSFGVPFLICIPHSRNMWKFGLLLYVLRSWNYWTSQYS